MLAVVWVVRFLFFASCCFGVLQTAQKTSDSDPTNYIFTNDIETALMPSIGNGYVSSFVYSEEIFVAGLFNGFLNVAPSHRASIPSPINYQLSLSDATEGNSLQSSGYLFDIPHGMFSAFYTVTSQNGDVLSEIEQRWYAHREHRALIVHEILLNNSMNADSLHISVSNGLTSFTSSDITFTEQPKEGTGAACFNGSINQPETLDGLQVTVSVCTEDAFADKHKSIAVPSHSETSERFVTVLQTNIPGDSNSPVTTAPR